MGHPTSLDLKRTRKLVTYSVALLVLVMAFAALWNVYTVRIRLRWLFRSTSYKARVLAAGSRSGRVRYMEWDGWGWAGQDTLVYLVYDPQDKDGANSSAQNLPCEVAEVTKLAHGWYSVRFYTGERWGEAPCASAPAI